MENPHLTAGINFVFEHVYDDMCRAARLAALHVPRRTALNFICMTELMKIYLFKLFKYKNKVL